MRPSVYTVRRSWRAPDGLRSAILALNSIVALALALGLYVSASTHAAPVGGFVGSTGPAVHPAAAPHWTPALARRFPGFDGRQRLSDRVVVIRLDGAAQRMSFDEAWRRGQTDTRADDVWTVGWQRSSAAAAR
jgi:hypothetical protein